MAAIMLFAASVVLGFGLVYSASKLAPRVGLLDRPGGRKTHSAPVPVVGGIGMFLAFAALIPFTDAPASLSVPLLCACALVVATGFLDDLKDLRPLPKFVAQVAAATLMSAGAGFALTDLGHLLGPWTLSLSVLAVPFTVFAAVGVMNAINMSDGVDGLAGGIAFIAVVWFIVAALAGGTHYADELLAFGGVVGAFLLLNMRGPWRGRAAVFMGDAGSLFLGLVLAWFAVALATSPGSALSPIAAVWVLALPITDTLAAMARRAVRGKSPFHADREHAHHLLLAAGYSDRETVALLLFSSLVFGAVGVGGWMLGVPDYVMFYAYGALFAVHFVAVMNAGSVVNLLRRGGRYELRRDQAPPIAIDTGVPFVRRAGATMVGPAVAARKRTRPAEPRAKERA